MQRIAGKHQKPGQRPGTDSPSELPQDSKTPTSSHHICERIHSSCLIHPAVGICYSNPQFSSVQSSSVAQSCPTLCDPINRSMPGLPVHHQLPEFTQTHAYRVGDAIQPSHPLLCPSPPALNPSQHQGLFQWVNSLQEVAKATLGNY